MTTAAGVVIGDEILSGKVQDTNSRQLIRVMQDAGVELMRIVIIGDDPESIAFEVEHCKGRFDHVVTSGGIGPTHDDRTMEGVARAFGLSLVREPELERLVRHHFAGRVNEAALKLAEVPAGARILSSDDGMLPLVSVENVFILPGIPKLFEAKLRRVRDELSGQRWVTHAVHISADESSIAEHLSQVDQVFPKVRIGSYPRLDSAEHRVLVTVESLDAGLADRALERLLELLPPERVVRVKKQKLE